MDTVIALSHLALLWPILCSAQQSTFTVATLQIADDIWSGAPSPTVFVGSVTTSINNSNIITAYTIPCAGFQFCTSGSYLGFTVTTGSTTYNLSDYGTVVCGVTDSGPGPSGTATCTDIAPYGEFYTQNVSESTYTESSSYAIYFATMDPALSSSLSATTTTSIPTSAAAASAAATSTAAPSPAAPSTAAASTAAPSTAAASTAAPSTAGMTTASLSEISVTTSTSAGISASITTSASSTSTSSAQTAQITSSSPTSSATGSHDLTEHQKIGVGVGIVAFVLVCCAIGFFLKSYRQKRRAESRNPSELYFNADGT